MEELPGDALRNAAAELLQTRLGRAFIEHRASGKKVDIYFEERHFGKVSRTYVEAKDYNRVLRRSDVVNIWTDYSGIIAKNNPAILLLVTRNGLSADAQSYVEDEQSNMRHQTIREIENETIGLDNYLSIIAEEFYNDGLSEYYIDSYGYKVEYDAVKSRNTLTERIDLFKYIENWLNIDTSAPIAVLGGYGAGKSSLSKKIVSYAASEAKVNANARKPILIRLGSLTRYSSIEGLLGGMFTSEYPVPSFRFQTFQNLNRNGRFLIILDGFDEMKHAMSWSDFRSQVRDLNRFVIGNSKVILLGRPNAFISFEEHVHVLKGIKRIGDQWRREIDWPDFEEFELSDFNHDERDRFVERYLSFRFGLDYLACDQREEKNSRIEEVKALMLSDPELFGKPVHLKILCDLASEESIDLSRFKDSLTRWDLYEVFFNDLLERDAEKIARRGLDSNIRLGFLRELAYWLWTERAGQISFSADELPRSLVVQLNLQDDDDIDSMLRELLVGAFIEKKGGHYFYFGHRSFAEFLVAQRIVFTTPIGKDVSTYGRICTDGVLAFLEEYEGKDRFRGLAKAFYGGRGEVCFDFVHFVARKSGGKGAFIHEVTARSLIGFLADVTLPQVMGGRSNVDSKLSLDDKILFNRMLVESNRAFFGLLHLVLRSKSERVIRGKSFNARLIAVLLERVFMRVQKDDSSSVLFVGSDNEEAKNLASRCLSEIQDTTDGRMISLRWDVLMHEYANWLKGDPLRIGTRESVDDSIIDGQIQVYWNDVLRAIADDDVRNLVSSRVSAKGLLLGVVTRGRLEKSRGGQFRYP